MSSSIIFSASVLPAARRVKRARCAPPPPPSPSPLPRAAGGKGGARPDGEPAYKHRPSGATAPGFRSLQQVLPVVSPDALHPVLGLLHRVLARPDGAAAAAQAPSAAAWDTARTEAMRRGGGRALLVDDRGRDLAGLGVGLLDVVPHRADAGVHCSPGAGVSVGGGREGQGARGRGRAQTPASVLFVSSSSLLCSPSLLRWHSRACSSSVFRPMPTCSAIIVLQ